MKKTRTFLVALMCALLMLPLFSNTAQAAGSYTFVVQQTVTGETTGGNTKYTYLLYQILKGTPSTNASGKTVLSDVQWGNGVKDDTKEKVYNMFGLTGTDRTAAKVAEKVAENAGNDVFHTILTNLGTSDGSSLLNPTTLKYNTYTVNSQSVTGYGATGLEAGYYLVRNTVVPDSDTYSDYIVEVVGGDVTAEPKAATPSSSKKTQDVNDSLGTTLSSNQDSADYDIGDSIPFTLTATLPTNFANYQSVGYYLSFVDDMSEGLTWDGSATIYFGAADTTGSSVTFEDMNGKTVHMEEGDQVVNTEYTNGKLWCYDIENLFTGHNDLKGGDVITVKYNATLNAKAVVSSYGNQNKSRIYYSNSPTQHEKVGSTPDDVNVVFTYKTVFNKVDENGSALTGADFTLSKFVANSAGATTITIDGSAVKGNWVNVTQLHTGTGAINPTKTGSSASSSFTFSGLDDGVYLLSETTTPTGYNTMDDIQFTITAEHEIASNNPALTALAGTDGASFTMTSSLENASLTSNVENKPGLVLPSTGGVGTTMFYVVGSLLLGGAVVAAIVKRRMSAE